MPHSRFSSICRTALFIGCLATLNVHSSLSAPDWQAVPGVIGNSIELRADTQRFFRLHKP
jgi:hypothetical protein